MDTNNSVSLFQYLLKSYAFGDPRTTKSVGLKKLSVSQYVTEMNSVKPLVALISRKLILCFNMEISQFIFSHKNNLVKLYINILKACDSKVNCDPSYSWPHQYLVSFVSEQN